MSGSYCFNFETDLAQVAGPLDHLMKNGNANRRLWLPVDQWIALLGPFTIAFIAIITAQLLDFFTELSATGRPWWYVIALAVSISGASLILSAKLPLYRQGRIFTFGSRELPESRRAFYRWGYRFFLLGAVVLLFVSLSRP
jgi:hypothetical protein